MTRIGSLFSGYGGLDGGVQAALGGTVAWHCEYDQAPSKILAHHWPTVPNLGDITSVDWSKVEPVDVLTGGSPCQDVSAAGKRAGMRAGTRSGLWASMTDAIDQLRPGLVVWENVRGVLSAEADSALEPCPGCVGDGDDGPVLRALGRVLGDLSDLGYDARWCGLRAADVGAPHGRYRVFVVATDTRGEHGQQRRVAAPGQTAAGWALGELAGRGRALAADPDGEGLQGRRAGGYEPEVAEPFSAGKFAADASGDGWDERWTESAGVVGGSDAAQRGTPTPADTEGYTGRISHRDDGVAPDADSDALRQQPVTVSGRSGQALTGLACTDAAFADAERGGRDGWAHEPLRGQTPRAAVAWGGYEPAIRRWERTLGRVAPAPTELAPRGGQRLSPRFVEWMMGLDEGHVTDPAIGISRNEQLKALGNGVVPQQAAAAVRFLLAARLTEAAA